MFWETTMMINFDWLMSNTPHQTSNIQTSNIFHSKCPIFEVLSNNVYCTSSKSKSAIEPLTQTLTPARKVGPLHNVNNYIHATNSTHSIRFVCIYYKLNSTRQSVVVALLLVTSAVTITSDAHPRPRRSRLRRMDRLFSSIKVRFELDRSPSVRRPSLVLSGGIAYECVIFETEAMDFQFWSSDNKAAAFYGTTLCWRNQKCHR